MTKNRFFIFLLVLIPVVTLSVSLPQNWLLASTKSTTTLDVKEGDIIFQISKSAQSKYIQKATGSPLSHCGIIVKVGKEYKVLETLKTLRLTPLHQFIARGKNQKYWIKRSNKKDIHISYKKYLGRPYDLAFKMDNNKYYCSELVYDIYQQQLGIRLCAPRPISSYHIGGLEKVIRQRGMNTHQLVVAPSDLFDSSLLKSVE